MISLLCLDSKLLTNNNWYGRFQLAPFRKSEGLTIANALRRTLLAEKSNFSISWVDLYNAEIPYSVLTGMRESVFDILLNLKQIIFTSDTMMAHRFHTPNLNMSLKTNKNKFPAKEKILQASQSTNEYYEKNKSFPVRISYNLPSLFSLKKNRGFPLNTKKNRLDSNFIRDFLSRESSPLNDFIHEAKTKNFNDNFQNKGTPKGFFKDGFSSFMRSSTEPRINSSEDTYKGQQAGFQESKTFNMSSNVKNKNFFSKSNDVCNPVIIGYICVKGPATIYGKNLKLPKGIKCLNPDQYIVTLSDDGVFYFRFAIHYELKNQLVFNAIPRDFPFFPISLIELNQNQNIFWQTLFSNVNTTSLPNPQRKLFEQTKTKKTDSNNVFHQKFFPSSLRSSSTPKSWKTSQTKIKKSFESIKQKKLLKTNILKNFYILHFSPKKDFWQAKNFFKKTLKINSLFLQLYKTRVSSLFHTFSSLLLSFTEKKIRKDNNRTKEEKFSEFSNSKSNNLNLFRPSKLDNYFWSWPKDAFFLNNKSFSYFKKRVATSKPKQPLFYSLAPWEHNKKTNKSQFRRVFPVFQSVTDPSIVVSPDFQSVPPPSKYIESLAHSLSSKFRFQKFSLGSEKKQDSLNETEKNQINSPDLSKDVDPVVHASVSSDFRSQKVISRSEKKKRSKKVTPRSKQKKDPLKDTEKNQINKPDPSTNVDPGFQSVPDSPKTMDPIVHASMDYGVQSKKKGRPRSKQKQDPLNETEKNQINKPDPSTNVDPGFQSVPDSSTDVSLGFESVPPPSKYIESLTHSLSSKFRSQKFSPRSEKKQDSLNETEKNQINKSDSSTDVDLGFESVPLPSKYIESLAHSLSSRFRFQKFSLGSEKKQDFLKKTIEKKQINKPRTPFVSPAFRWSKKQSTNLPEKNKLILDFWKKNPFRNKETRRLASFKEMSNQMPQVLNTPWFLENVYQNFFICFRKKQRCFKLNSLGLIEKSLNPLAKSENDTLKKISTPLISPTNIEKKTEKNFCTCQNSSIISNIKKTCLINLQVKHSYYKSGCLDRFLVDLLKLFKPSISFRGFSSIDLNSVDEKKNLQISFPKMGNSLRVARQNRKKKSINKPGIVSRKKNNTIRHFSLRSEKPLTPLVNLLTSSSSLQAQKAFKRKNRMGEKPFLTPNEKKKWATRRLLCFEKLLPVWNFKTTNTFNMQFFISSFRKKKTFSSDFQKVKPVRRLPSLARPFFAPLVLRKREIEDFSFSEDIKNKKKLQKKIISLNKRPKKKKIISFNKSQIIIASQKQKKLKELDIEIYKERITEFLQSQKKDVRAFTWTKIAHQFNLYNYYDTKSKEWKQLQEWFKCQKKPSIKDKSKKEPPIKDQPVRVVPHGEPKEPSIQVKPKQDPLIKVKPKQDAPIQVKPKQDPLIKVKPKQDAPIQVKPARVVGDGGPKKKPRRKDELARVVGDEGPKKTKQKINQPTPPTTEDRKKHRQKLSSKWTRKKSILQNQHLLKWELGIKNFLDIGIITEKTFYNKLEFLKNKKKLNFSSLPNSNTDTQSLTFFIPNNTIMLKPSYLNIEPLFHILKQSVKFHENQRILSRNLNLFFSVSISFILHVLVSHLFSLVGIDPTTRFCVVNKSFLANFAVNNNFYLSQFSPKTFQFSSWKREKKHRTGNHGKRKRQLKKDMVSETTLFLGDSFFRHAKTKHIGLKSSTKINKISRDLEGYLNKLLLWSCLWPLVSKPLKKKTIKQISPAFLKPTIWDRKSNRGKRKNFNILWNNSHKQKITCSKKYYQTFYHSKIYFSLRYTYPLKYTIFSHYSSMGWFSKTKNTSVGKAILNRLAFLSKICFSSLVLCSGRRKLVSSLKKNICSSSFLSQSKKQRPIRGLKKSITKRNSTFFPLINGKQTDYKQTIKKKNFYYLPPKNVKPWWVPYSESFKIYTNLMTYENLFNYKRDNRASLIQKTDGTITKTDDFFLLNNDMNQINNFSFLKYEMDLDKKNFSIFFPYKSFVIPWNPKKDKNSQINTKNLAAFDDELEFSKPKKVKKVFHIYDKSELINFEIFKNTYLEKINNGTLYNSIRNFYVPFDYLLNHIIFPSFYWFNSITFSYKHRQKTRTLIKGNWQEKKTRPFSISLGEKKEEPPTDSLSRKKWISSPLKTKNYQRFIPIMGTNIINKPSITKAKIKNNSLAIDVQNYVQKSLSIKTASNNPLLIDLILSIYSQRKKKNFQITNQNITTKILNQKTFNDGFILVNSNTATSERIFSFSKNSGNGFSHGKKQYMSSPEWSKKLGISNAKAREKNQKESSKGYLKIFKNSTSKLYGSCVSEITPYFSNSLPIKPTNYQKQWIGPSKKTIEIYKSHFPYTFLSREKNNVFFSNFIPTNLVSISSEIETTLLSNKEISWFQSNQKFFRSHSPSKLLLQTFIKTHTNHYVRNQNFLLAYLNTKKFIINPFKKQGNDSLFKYLKSCQLQKSLIPENLLTTYKYFQSSNLLTEDFLNSLMKKDSLTSEFFELKKENLHINKLKFSATKDYKNYLFKARQSTNKASLSKVANNSAFRKASPAINKQTEEEIFSTNERAKKRKKWQVSSSAKNDHLFGSSMGDGAGYNKLFFDPKSQTRKKASSLEKTFLLPFRLERENWGKKQNKWKSTPVGFQDSNLKSLPQSLTEREKNRLGGPITEKKLVRTLSNTQCVMANNFPQNFTMKSKNENFHRLHEKMKIPVAFEIFFHRRFLWNSNKITLQILNRQAFMVSLASDRKFKMTTLKPLFKEVKIKKIAFLKHGYRRINHQQKVSKIMFSNLQLSNLKNYQNYFSLPQFSDCLSFIRLAKRQTRKDSKVLAELDGRKTQSKISHAFDYDFSWLNKIQQNLKKEKKIPVNRLPVFIQKSILSLSSSNLDFDHNTISTEKKKDRNERLEHSLETSLAIFKETRLPAIIYPQTASNKGKPARRLPRFVEKKPLSNNTIDKFLPLVYSLIGDENQFFTNLSEHKLKRVTNQLNKSLVPISWKLFSFVEQNMVLKEIKRFYAFFLKPSIANFSGDIQPFLPDQIMTNREVQEFNSSHSSTLQKASTTLDSQPTNREKIVGAAPGKIWQAGQENNQIDLWSCGFFSKYFVYTTSLESDLFFQNFLNFSFSKFDLNKIFSKKPTFSISKSHFNSSSVFTPFDEALAPASRFISLSKREHVGTPKKLYSQKKMTEKELMEWNDSQPLVKKSFRTTNSVFDSKNISSMLIPFNRYFLRSFEEQSKEGRNKSRPASVVSHRRLKNISKETMQTPKDNTINFSPFVFYPNQEIFFPIMEKRNTILGFPTDGQRKKKLFYFGKLTQKIETNQVLLRPVFQTERMNLFSEYPVLSPIKESLGVSDEMLNVFQNFYLISRQLVLNKNLQIGSAEKQIFPWSSIVGDNLSGSKNKQITLCYFTIKESLNPIYKVNYIIENFDITWDKTPLSLFQKKQPKKPSWKPYPYVKNLFPLHFLTRQVLIGSILDRKTNQQNIEKIIPPFIMAIHFETKKRKKSIRLTRLNQKIENKRKKYLLIKNSDRFYRSNLALPIKNMRKTKLLPGKSINKWQIWYSFLIKQNKTSLSVLNNYNGIISIPKWKNQNSFLVPFYKDKDVSKETLQKLNINNPLNFEMTQPGSFAQIANNNKIIQNSNYNQINPIEDDIKKEYIQIDIWTNGSISPRQSLVNAFQKLFELFCNLSNNSSIKNNNVLLSEKEREFVIIEPESDEEEKKKILAELEMDPLAPYIIQRFLN